MKKKNNLIAKNNSSRKLSVDQNFISKIDFENFKYEIKSMLNESVITDLNSLEDNYDNSNFIKLLKEGYSKKTIYNVFEYLKKQESTISINNF